VVVLLLISVALVPLGLVRVKMLPFDNKSELQVVINMPDGTPLEQTARVAQALGEELARQPDVLNYQSLCRNVRSLITSTGWCATTTCAGSRIRPTSR
jgi:multidrug efflux pump subunit AcrB